MSLKRPCRRWFLLGVLAIALTTSVACVSERWERETTLVLGKVDGGDTAAIEYEGKVLVAAEDVPGLFESIRSVNAVEGRRQLVSSYLTRQNRINCILKKFDDADTNKEEIKCEGKVLVEKKDVPELAAKIRPLDKTAGTSLVASYLFQWERTQRLDRSLESLNQIENTRAIPLVGRLLDFMTRFPVTWEGEVLVPKDEIPKLNERLRSAGTDEARRSLVEAYLRERGAIPVP